MPNPLPVREVTSALPTLVPAPVPPPHDPALLGSLRRALNQSLESRHQIFLCWSNTPLQMLLDRPQLLRWHLAIGGRLLQYDDLDRAEILARTRCLLRALHPVDRALLSQQIRD